MRRYGRFVPTSTITSRMDAKDARIQRETAARQRATVRRVHGWVIDAVQSGKADIAYTFAKLLAHLAPKEV